MDSYAQQEFDILYCNLMGLGNLIRVTYDQFLDGLNKLSQVTRCFILDSLDNDESG